MTDVLSREQIETLRVALHLVWPKASLSADTLCDMALSALDNAEDAERLASLAWPDTFCDEYGGVDIHEEASVNASAFGREEPNRDDYVAAVRAAIDAARKEATK